MDNDLYVIIKLCVILFIYSDLKKFKWIKTESLIFSSADCVSTTDSNIPKASNLLFIKRL